MQRSTFKVLFYVKRQSEKHGQVPVMGRITINGTMSQFSSKLSVRSSLWDAKANKASGKSLESQRINEKLENIKTNIGKQYQRLCDRDSYVTAEKVRNAFLGMGDDCRLLLQPFDEYLVKNIPFKELKRDFDAFVFKHKDISPSYRCASMSRVVNCRMISKQDVRWRYCAIWNANTICIRVSKVRNRRPPPDFVRCTIEKGPSNSSSHPS